MRQPSPRGASPRGPSRPTSAHTPRGASSSAWLSRPTSARLPFTPVPVPALAPSTPSASSLPGSRPSSARYTRTTVPPTATAAAVTASRAPPQRSVPSTSSSADGCTDPNDGAGAAAGAGLSQRYRFVAPGPEIRLALHDPQHAHRDADTSALPPATTDAALAADGEDERTRPATSPRRRCPPPQVPVITGAGIATAASRPASGKHSRPLSAVSTATTVAAPRTGAGSGLTSPTKPPRGAACSALRHPSPALAASAVGPSPRPPPEVPADGLAARRGDTVSHAAFIAQLRATLRSERRQYRSFALCCEAAMRTAKSFAVEEPLAAASRGVVAATRYGRGGTGAFLLKREFQENVAGRGAALRPAAGGPGGHRSADKEDQSTAVSPATASEEFEERAARDAAEAVYQDDDDEGADDGGQDAVLDAFAARGHVKNTTSPAHSLSPAPQSVEEQGRSVRFQEPSPYRCVSSEAVSPTDPSLATLPGAHLGGTGSVGGAAFLSTAAMAAEAAAAAKTVAANLRKADAEELRERQAAMSPRLAREAAERRAAADNTAPKSKFPIGRAADPAAVAPSESSHRQYEVEESKAVRVALKVQKAFAAAAAAPDLEQQLTPAAAYAHLSPAIAQSAAAILGTDSAGFQRPMPDARAAGDAKAASSEEASSATAQRPWSGVRPTRLSAGEAGAGEKTAAGFDIDGAAAEGHVPGFAGPTAGRPHRVVVSTAVYLMTKLSHAVERYGPLMRQLLAEILQGVYTEFDPSELLGIRPGLGEDDRHASPKTAGHHEDGHQQQQQQQQQSGSRPATAGARPHSARTTQGSSPPKVTKDGVDLSECEFLLKKEMHWEAREAADLAATRALARTGQQVAALRGARAVVTRCVGRDAERVLGASFAAWRSLTQSSSMAATRWAAAQRNAKSRMALRASLLRWKAFAVWRLQQRISAMSCRNSERLLERVGTLQAQVTAREAEVAKQRAAKERYQRRAAQLEEIVALEKADAARLKSRLVLSEGQAAAVAAQATALTSQAERAFQKLANAPTRTVEKAGLVEFRGLALVPVAAAGGASAPVRARAILMAWLTERLADSGRPQPVLNLHEDLCDGHAFVAAVACVAQRALPAFELAAERCAVALQAAKQLKLDGGLTVPELLRGDERINCLFLSHLFARYASADRRDAAMPTTAKARRRAQREAAARAAQELAAQDQERQTGLSRAVADAQGTLARLQARLERFQVDGERHRRWVELSRVASNFVADQGARQLRGEDPGFAQRDPEFAPFTPELLRAALPPDSLKFAGQSVDVYGVPQEHADELHDALQRMCNDLRDALLPYYTTLQGAFAHYATVTHRDTRHPHRIDSTGWARFLTEARYVPAMIARNRADDVFERLVEDDCRAVGPVRWGEALLRLFFVRRDVQKVDAADIVERFCGFVNATAPLMPRPYHDQLVADFFDPEVQVAVRQFREPMRQLFGHVAQHEHSLHNPRFRLDGFQQLIRDLKLSELSADASPTRIYLAVRLALAIREPEEAVQHGVGHLGFTVCLFGLALLRHGGHPLVPKALCLRRFLTGTVFPHYQAKLRLRVPESARSASPTAARPPPPK